MSPLVSSTLHPHLPIIALLDVHGCCLVVRYSDTSCLWSGLFPRNSTFQWSADGKSFIVGSAGGLECYSLEDGGRQCSRRVDLDSQNGFLLNSGPLLYCIDNAGRMTILSDDSPSSIELYRDPVHVQHCCSDSGSFYIMHKCGDNLAIDHFRFMPSNMSTSASMASQCQENVHSYKKDLDDIVESIERWIALLPFKIFDSSDALYALLFLPDTAKANLNEQLKLELVIKAAIRTIVDNFQECDMVLLALSQAVARVNTIMVTPDDLEMMNVKVDDVCEALSSLCSVVEGVAVDVANRIQSLSGEKKVCSQADVLRQSAHSYECRVLHDAAIINGQLYVALATESKGLVYRHPQAIATFDVAEHCKVRILSPRLLVVASPRNIEIVAIDGHRCQIVCPADGQPAISTCPNRVAIIAESCVQIYQID